MYHQVRGLADWIFIAVIVSACSVIGMLTPQITKEPDTPIEQLSEKIIKMETGQEVDFSAHLKKLPNGKVVATDMKSQTTHGPIVPVTPGTGVIIGDKYTK